MRGHRDDCTMTLRTDTAVASDCRVQFGRAYFSTIGCSMSRKNLTKDSQKRVLNPPSFGTFSPASGVIALSFLYRNPRLSTPEALLEGSENYSGGCIVWYFFFPPYVLHRPRSGPRFGARCGLASITNPCSFAQGVPETTDRGTLIGLCACVKMEPREQANRALVVML